MKYTAIVVDDEVLIAKNIAKSIERTNEAFAVAQICTCASEAIEYVQSHTVDVVFMDIQMPEMSGLEFAEYLAKEHPYIISGYDDFQYARRALCCNVKDYLLKPLNLDDLTVCLSNIVKRLQVLHADFSAISNKNRAGNTPEEIVEIVRAYIHENYRTPVNLTNLAESMGFSPAYLTKIFVRHTGMAPSKYAKEYRMKIAEQMLKDPNISIASISESIGFADQFHFSKSFKAYTGLSPSQYRNKIFSEHTS